MQTGFLFTLAAAWTIPAKLETATAALPHTAEALPPAAQTTATGPPSSIPGSGMMTAAWRLEGSRAREVCSFGFTIFTPF